MSEITARRDERPLKRNATLEVRRAALWLILGLQGCLGLGPLWVQAMRPAPGQLNDFYQDWGSARNHLVGLPVYTQHAISIPRHLGLPSNLVPGIEYNAHPPTSVLLASPLARVAYPDAVFDWNAISLATLFASLVIVAAVPLLVPIAVIAREIAISRSRWMLGTLVLILTIEWIPQNTLTELAQAGHSLRVAPWTFMLGAPSLKFYALPGTFALGLAAFQAGMEMDEDVPR
jgi:hypothetical protein